MKHFFFLVCVVAPAWAQFIVHDPGNTAVNTAVQAGQAANHLETMRQWASQLEALNRQLRQLEDQLSVQSRIRDVIGDPSVAGTGVTLRELGALDLSRTYGDTLAAARRVGNAVESLRRTSDGIFRRLDDRTSLGREFVRSTETYRRFATIERQADARDEVQAQSDQRIAAVQTEIAAAVAQLKDAGTQAETDKLHAKLLTLNGQLAHAHAVRRDEADKLRSAQILNDNQSAKERQDLLEKQLAEERQTLEAVGTWQQAIRLTPTSYTQP